MSQARLVSHFVPVGLSRAVTRFAVRAIPGLRDTTIQSPAIPFPGGSGPRGSGSWANEWDKASGRLSDPVVDRPAKTAFEALPDMAPDAPSGIAKKAPIQALSAKTRDSATKRTAPGAVPGSVRPRPLMNHADKRLHDWLADHLEVQAPTCTLHAGVALSAFLVSDRGPGDMSMAGLFADFVIADAHGHPVVVLIRETDDNSEQHSRSLDLLIDAFVPVIDLEEKPVLSEVWSEISESLPLD